MTMALAASMTLFTACTDNNEPGNGDGGEDNKYELTKDIESDTELEAGKTYTLSGGIHVKNGATLKIPAGVTIIAKHDDVVDYILIEQGAKIDAQGTASNPIVMTSEKKEPGACIMKTYTKPYASCRYTHPSVEAAIHLREQVRIEDIEHIDIKTYSLAVAGHDHTDIPGSYSAKMSIPYATATGLIYGKAGLQEFSEESVREEKRLNLTKKIHVESDDELSVMFPGVQAAIVHITKTDGSVLVERVDFPKGEPENPLDEAEFKDRYDSLMTYAHQAHGDEIYQLVYAENAKIRKVMEIIGGVIR